MYEGQQVVEAIFRQKTERKRPKVANIDFDPNGVFQFVGTPDTFEGVRNLLGLHGVYPDVDPLAAAVIVPVNPATGESAGESGVGAVKPPSEDYSDLDDLTDIKELKAKANDVPSDPAVVSATTGSGEAPVQSASGEPASAGDLLNGAGASSDAGGTARAASGGDNELRPETATAEPGAPAVDDNDDADFSFT